MGSKKACGIEMENDVPGRGWGVSFWGGEKSYILNINFSVGVSMYRENVTSY